MTYFIYKITPNDHINVTPYDVNDDGTIELETLWKAVDCTCIQIIRLGDGIAMVIDDEGKLLNKPVNMPATVLFAKYCRTLDFIFGNAVIVSTRPPVGYDGDPDVFGFDDRYGWRIYLWLRWFISEVHQRKALSPMPKPRKGG